MNSGHEIEMNEREMSQTTHVCAAAHFELTLSTWGGPETYTLREGDPLPDTELSWWWLHPHEVRIFGIDPDLHPRLLEAFSWYAGAITGSAHNDYYDFREEEQRRWAQFVVTRCGESVFDRASCQSFMHEAAALPLRQCEAMIQKMAACELRGRTLVLRDEMCGDDADADRP